MKKNESVCLPEVGVLKLYLFGVFFYVLNLKTIHKTWVIFSHKVDSALSLVPLKEALIWTEDPEMSFLAIYIWITPNYS